MNRAKTTERIAFYLIAVAVVLALGVGTVRLIESNSNHVFSSVASAIGDSEGSYTPTSAGDNSAVVVHPSTGEERKLVRKAYLLMTVDNPAECADRVRQLVENAGGYLVTSAISGRAPTAMLR